MKILVFLPNTKYPPGTLLKNSTTRKIIFKVILFIKTDKLFTHGNKLINPNNITNGIKGKTKTLLNKNTEEKLPLINTIYGNTKTWVAKVTETISLKKFGIKFNLEKIIILSNLSVNIISP